MRTVARTDASAAHEEVLLASFQMVGTVLSTRRPR
jgi:hypothetical protein